MIYYFGSLDEAKKFTCKIATSNENGESFTYTGKIHTLDEKADDIIASEFCFRISCIPTPIFSTLEYAITVHLHTHIPHHT